MERETTQPTCDGHNWEVSQIRPEYWGGDGTHYDREIAIVICTFCGIVRKTKVENL